MAQLPQYDPSNFTGKSFDESILADLDAEFAAIKAVLDAARGNLVAIQRDDTKLKNDAVHRDALTDETRALFAAAWNPRGGWQTATAYKRRDVVVESADTWVCTQDHTSGTFATDQANELWLPISTTGAGGDALLEVVSAGTAGAYTISTGNAYSDWGSVPPLLARWHATNNASATVAVDGLAAKAMQTVDGDPVPAGVLTGTDLLVYDASTDAVRVIAREGPIPSQPSVKTAITANKTLTDSDLAGVSHLVQLVDFSAGSGNTIALTLPVASNNVNTIVTFVASADAGQNRDNRAELRDSGGSEIGTLFQVGDFVQVVSNGSAWVVVDERFTLEVELALTANSTIALGSTAKVFDTGYSVEQNIGQHWDHVVNHRFDHPGITDALLMEVACVRAAHENVSLYPKHSANGAYLDAAGLAAGSTSFDLPPVHLTLASGQSIDFEAYNNDAAGQDLFGDVARTQTRVRLRAVRRLR